MDNTQENKDKKIEAENFNLSIKKNIDELISDMRETLLMTDKIKKIQTFLGLLPSEDILTLMANNNSLTKEQSEAFLEIISSIRPELEEYEYYLLLENKKLSQIQTYFD